MTPDLTEAELDELGGLAHTNVNSSSNPCDERIARLSESVIAELRRRREAMSRAAAAIDELARALQRQQTWDRYEVQNPLTR